MNYQHSGFAMRRGASGSKDCDEDLKAAVLNGSLVVYIDEWSNNRTMEARAYGLTPGDRPVLIGFQIDGDQGIPREQLWKMIDVLDRLVIKESGAQFVHRMVPPQYAAQLKPPIFAIAPETGMDVSNHEADGY
jgi:hypothetical protein